MRKKTEIFAHLCAATSNCWGYSKILHLGPTHDRMFWNSLSNAECLGVSGAGPTTASRFGARCSCTSDGQSPRRMKLKVASGHNKRPIKSFQKAGLKGDVTLTILKCLAFWTWTPGPYAKPRQGQGIKLEPSHVLQCVDRACQGHGVEICSTSPVSSLFNWWRTESHLNILLGPLNSLSLLQKKFMTQIRKASLHLLICDHTGGPVLFWVDIGIYNETYIII